MLWLWWRWNANYIWVTSKIFLCSCWHHHHLVNVYGVQDGHMSTTAKVTIIVVSSTAGAEHDRQMGEQAAGKHGEGVLKSLMKSKNSEKNSERKDV
ncbi:hypothetical protein BKA70DRAFT_1297385 [Coprinopsis sp. MPI-PUGE-AT-0042]|nr:hypothetical protein BKA70DRAFT_1297385 [Coprinopsis sp. MPI-PUGE-AT-0042]